MFPFPDEAEGSLLRLINNQTKNGLPSNPAVRTQGDPRTLLESSTALVSDNHGAHHRAAAGGLECDGAAGGGNQVARNHPGNDRRERASLARRRVGLLFFLPPISSPVTWLRAAANVSVKILNVNL